MVASKSTSIIRMFREILGDQTGTGYTLNVDSLSVPNSLNTGKFNLPELDKIEEAIIANNQEHFLLYLMTILQDSFMTMKY